MESSDASTVYTRVCSVGLPLISSSMPVELGKNVKMHKKSKKKCCKKSLNTFAQTIVMKK